MTNQNQRWQQAFATVADEASYIAFVADRSAADAQLARLLSQLGVAGDWTRPARGSALVAMTDTEVVKLMPPHDSSHADVEAICLQALDNTLPVATPQLREAGSFEGWRYLRMTRLPGRELTELWPTLDRPAQLALATQLGETLQALHTTSAPASITRLDWPRWVAERRASIITTQRNKGCPEALLEALPAFLASAPLEEQRTAWLHTEVMREHLLVSEQNGQWRLSGMFDFEPSWVAPVDYEFAAVGLFVSAGDAEVLGNVLKAANVAASPARLLAMTLMHRYLNLAWYLERLGGRPSLHALADAWFDWR